MSAAGRGERGGFEMDFYATPRPAVDAIMPYILSAIAPRRLADVTILDSSAGRGNLIAAALAHGADPSRCYAVEIDPGRSSVCAGMLPAKNVIRGDFLSLSRGVGCVPDVIICNPPFNDGEAHLRRNLSVVHPRGIVCALNRTAFYLEAEERADFRGSFPCDLYPMAWRLSFTREILTWATDEQLLAMTRPRTGAALKKRGPGLETLADVKARLSGCDNAPHAWAIFGEGRGGRYKVLEKP